jgi:integrase
MVAASGVLESFRLKRDAEARLTDIQNELKQGTHTPIKDSITLGEAGELWFSHLEARKLEQGTLRNYRGHLDRYIKPMLGHVKLGKLTTATVVDFRDQVMKKATAARAGKLLGTVKRIIAEAQLRGLCATNQALPVKVQTSNRGKKRLEIGVDIPSKEDIRLLLENAKGRWRPFYIVAVFTGMRASELRGLRWADVNLDKKQVHVRQRVDRWNNVGPPKSRAGQRSIPLTPFVVNTLREWRVACGGSGLVFPSANGTPLMHSNICNQSFYPLQAKAGVVR